MINLIVATAKNNVIGKDGKMLWNLPGELRYFKEKTEGNGQDLWTENPAGTYIHAGGKRIIQVIL